VVIWNRADSNSGRLNGATLQLFTDAGAIAPCSNPALLVNSGDTAELFTGDYKADIPISYARFVHLDS
jgi:hypothetical protein